MSDTLEMPVETIETVVEQPKHTEFETQLDKFFGVKEEDKPLVTEIVPSGNIIGGAVTNEPNWAIAFQEKTGGKVKDWDELNAILNKQTEVVQPQFANETSKNIYEALVNGKEDELEGYFLKRNMVKTLKDKPAEVVVKAHIREQYPTFTEQESDYFFNQQYSFDDTQFEDNEIGLSVAKKAAQQKLERAGSEALNYFSSKAEEVQLPKFEQPQQVPVQDLEIDKETAKQVAAFIESQGGNSLKGVEIPYKYSNKENGAEVEGKVSLDEKTISEYEEKVGERPDLVFAARYFKNGEYDRKAFARDQYILNNLPKLLQAAGGDMYNKGYVAKIMQDKNIPLQNAPASGNAPQVSDARSKAEEYKYNGFSDEAILRLTGVDLKQQ